MKNKKKLLIIGGIILVVLLAIILTFILLSKDSKNEGENTGANNLTNETLNTPSASAPAENTEKLLEDVTKMEVASLENDTIEFEENIQVEKGDKIAVWVYSKPKFLGYFEVVVKNGVKKIEGLAQALKNLDIESGEHNLAFVTEEGDAIGYVDVYIEENKFFKDKKAAVESKYTTKEVTEEVEIKYTTENKKDVNKITGHKQVIQKGVNGLKKITYKVTYDENGKEISKDKVSEKVVKEAIKEIIEVGAGDFNLNTAKITGSFMGIMCTEVDLLTNPDGGKGCDDSKDLKNFSAISIDDIDYLIKVDGSEVNATKISVYSGMTYKGTYKGTVYYFDARGGSGGEEPLTVEDCQKYNLSCGNW